MRAPDAVALPSASDAFPDLSRRYAQLGAFDQAMHAAESRARWLSAPPPTAESGRVHVCTARSLIWFARASCLFVFNFGANDERGYVDACGLAPLPEPLSAPLRATLCTDDAVFGGSGGDADLLPPGDGAPAGTVHVRVRARSACVFSL